MTALPPEIEANYEVLQTMGGGMGTVYKVRHRHFGETLVIKVMQAQLLENQELKDRFTAEAKRGKQLRQRNIAEVRDFQIGSNGNPYLVMEYIDGINLRDEFARRGGPLDPRMVVTIGVQTLAALGYLHSHNLIHRDISPDNLMIARDTDGSPLIKLIDLGIAKSLEDNSILTQTGSFLGKISYASPEQFGGVIDGRSDFYSLGVVLYELLTAQKPITGATTTACMLAHCQTPPRPFSETDPNHHVPEALRAVVLKALAKKPEDRYQTAAEFSSALQSALPAAPVLTAEKTTPLMPRPAAPAPVTEIVAPQANRGSQTFLLLAAIGAVVVIIAVAALAFFQNVRNRQVRAVTVSQPPVTASAVLGQPAGSAIAIEAPKPLPLQPEQRVAAANPPSVLIDERPAPTPSLAAQLTTSAQVAPPVTTSLPARTPMKILPAAPAEPGTHARVEPPISRSSQPPQHGLDLAEGDRRRRDALALSNSHQWASAVTAWHQFIHDYSGVNLTADHAAYYNLGVAYEALEQWPAAADAFEHATLADANINDTNNLLRLGRAYGKVGRWSDAVAAYKRVLRNDPSNQVAKRSLIRALEQEPPTR
jgi:serine/threonine protein kinase